MEYRRLGNSGLKVSELGLGTYSFGGRADEATSIKVINGALEMGVNFIDTAASYADGQSEVVVGKAVKGKRSSVVIASKFGSRREVRADRQHGSRTFIIDAMDASLKRLGTDYVDLYFIHRPDPETPIEETLRAMDDLVRAGKVRYIGCSNFAAWQVCEALLTSRLHNLEPFVVLESKYNLLDRSIEPEVVPCCQAYGVGVIPWAPLAGGFLTGRYHRGEPPPKGSRLSIGDYGATLTEANFDKLAKLEAFARERGHSVGELAVAWLLSHPWLGVVIIGTMSVDQLSSNMGAAGWRLSAEEMTLLDKIV